MKYIKLSISLAVIAVVALLIAPGYRLVHAAGAQSNRSEERFERTLSFSSGGTFSVENYKGRIEIIGGNRSDIRVDVIKYAVGSDSARRRWLNDINVSFSESSNRAGVRVEYPNHNCFFCNNDDTLED